MLNTAATVVVAWHIKRTHKFNLENELKKGKQTYKLKSLIKRDFNLLVLNQGSTCIFAINDIK